MSDLKHEHHASKPEPLLRLERLAVAYDAQTAVEDVTFGLSPGEVVALVGESGSGKTTTVQAVIGPLPESGKLTSGRILLGEEDVARWSPRRLDSLRDKRISLIPQDPGSSLNPTRTIGSQVAEVFRLHGWRDRNAVRQKVLEGLEHVGLTQPERRLSQYPHDLAVVRAIADTVSVLKNGLHLERGPVQDVFDAPKDDYTRRLIASIPGRKVTIATQTPELGALA